MKEFRKIDVKVATRNADGGGCIFTGRPIVYDSSSHLLGNKFRERFAKGAFRAFLASNPDVVACIDHDESKLLGRTTNGTLKLVETDDGIDIECLAPNTTYANDLRMLIERGDIRGMSFHFDDAKATWEKADDGVPLRTVTSAILYEVSFVASPAYPQTQAGLRSAEQVEVPTLSAPKLSVWRARNRLQRLQ